MTALTQSVLPNIYLTLDCEFTEEGLVRELVLLLFKDNHIVRALEVFISPSGSSRLTYHPKQINYHLDSPHHLNRCINSFLDTCKVYAPLEAIRVVGMSLEHDLKSLLKTTHTPSLLSKMPQKTQLELCGRGTLETKANQYNLSRTHMQRILDKIVTKEHSHLYKYHTALYDAIATGYVYLQVQHFKGHMGVHNRFKTCTHTMFKGYYQDTSPANKKDVTVPKDSHTPALTHVPKNFPELRYKVQKNISNVFDIVPRELFYRQFSKFRYEPSLKKVALLKEDIMKNVYHTKALIRTYDSGERITDPYNNALVHAGILLVEKKITVEDFIDFAIYMQQYNLPKNKGTYYKVWNNKKEIFVRCLQPSTAKKFLTKRPYCTIEHFLKKEIPNCYIEEIS